MRNACALAWTGVAFALFSSTAEGRQRVSLSAGAWLEAQDPAAATATGAASRILRGARDPETFSASDSARELGALGPSVAQPLVGMLATRRVPAVGELAPQVLSTLQEEVVLDALRRVDEDTVREVVVRTLASKDPARRVAAVLVVGAIGESRDLATVFEYALLDEEEHVESIMGDAFRRAVSEIVGRDDDAFVELARLRRASRPELLPDLVRALGAAGDPRGVELLADLFIWNEDLRLLAMSQIQALGPSPAPEINEELARQLLPYLDQEDPRMCAAAVLALGAIRDDASIPALIELLASEAVTANAHWALQRMTGLAFPADPKLWSNWHHSEIEWFKQHEERVLEDLSASDPILIAAAIREVGQRRIRRRPLAIALSDVLAHPRPAVRVLACDGLKQLDSRAAVPALVPMLEDPSLDVAGKAWEALTAITGLDHPLGSPEWRAVAHAVAR